MSKSERHYDRANRLFEKGRFRDALREFNLAIEIDPHEPDFYNDRGLVWDKLGIAERALEDFTAAIDLNPTTPAYFFNRARIFSLINEPERAGEDLTEVLHLDPFDSEALLLRGGVLADQMKWDDAIDDYNTAIDLTPDNADLFYDRGLAWEGRVRGVGECFGGLQPRPGTRPQRSDDPVQSRSCVVELREN